MTFGYIIEMARNFRKPSCNTVESGTFRPFGRRSEMSDIGANLLQNSVAFTA
jgi:hypothetical protein